MTNKSLGYFDLLAARRAWHQGQNVTELLRRQQGVAFNTPQIIETAYDLQAGTYIDYVRNHADQAARFADEIAGLLGPHLRHGDALLDVGSGELTTLSSVCMRLETLPSEVFAFDISWSRIRKGLAFARAEMGDASERLRPFVAEIGAIPLADKSIDVTTSCHALEPNGPNLAELLAELFRVTARALVLFEPSHEHASAEGRARMERLGYIRDMAGAVHRLGGRLLGQVPLRNVANPLNPTVCFVIEPPEAALRAAPAGRAEGFAVPGTALPLTPIDGFHFSPDTGLCFPELQGVPVLKRDAAILASALAA